MISLEVLTDDYPHFDHLTGSKYNGNDVQMIFSDSEQFITRLQTDVDEDEYDEH